MSDKSVPKEIAEQLRGVYLKILNELWSGEWVASSRLLRLTNQKYFDRRIRELRDEHGFDIESKNISGEWSYRLISQTPRFEKRQRRYPNASERKEVIRINGIKCNICGFIPPNGEIGGYLQYDHRVPFNERSGETTVENLQLVCTRCNVLKRRACQICKLPNCNNCPYAYPEKFGGTYVVAISKQSLKKYGKMAQKKGKKIEEILMEIIEH